MPHALYTSSRSYSKTSSASSSSSPLGTPGSVFPFQCSCPRTLIGDASQANYLKDLPPVDFASSPDAEDALEALQDRLRPLLGDLFEEHSALIDAAVDGKVGSGGQVQRPLFQMEIAGLVREGEDGNEKVDFVVVKIDSTPLV